MAGNSDILHNKGNYVLWEDVLSPQIRKINRTKTQWSRQPGHQQQHHEPESDY